MGVVCNFLLADDGVNMDGILSAGNRAQEIQG